MQLNSQMSTMDRTFSPVEFGANSWNKNHPVTNDVGCSMTWLPAPGRSPAPREESLRGRTNIALQISLSLVLSQGASCDKC